MRRYVVLVAHDPGAWEQASEEAREEYVAAHRAFEAYVDEHGRRLSSATLGGADTATTLRQTQGTTTVSDGPFAESAEQLGAYYDVELPDLDAAIAAGRLLSATSAVEIRPVVAVDGDEPA